MTAQQDHTLFELLGRRDIDVWLETIRVVRERGGVLVLTVHPDYMTSAERLDLYRAVLSRLTETRRPESAARRRLRLVASQVRVRDPRAGRPPRDLRPGPGRCCSRLRSALRRPGRQSLMTSRGPCW